MVKKHSVEELIYGTSKLEHIVACEYRPDYKLEIFRELPTGQIVSSVHEVPLFLISDTPIGDGWTELAGSLPLKWLKTVDTKDEWWTLRRRCRGHQLLEIYDERESAMLLAGFTQFKSLAPAQVSTLSFDIEATGIEHGPDAKVLLISNTFTKNGQVTRSLFAYDEYESEGAMLDAWCQWVRQQDPSIIVGHNIYTYDFPYLDYCARRAGTSLRLGRDGSALRFNDWTSKFRRDGTQFYDYKGINIYGRQIVDTFFGTIKYDVARKYDSYGLKSIIRQEGLEVKGRQHYDASQIRFNYKDPTEWAKIKAYAEHDADDSLALYQLMIPAFFYLARSVPKTFQTIMTGASGSQVNSLLIRSYLQAGHSLPVPSSEMKYEGAISIGNPGVYENVFKVDVASLYPSIMLEFGITDHEKEPLSHLLQILEHLTSERLRNKKLAKETGDRHYKDLEGAQKIIINSIYGFLGAGGLNFNSPSNAAMVTSIGRQILTRAIDWVGDSYKLVNADTDSISISWNRPWTDLDKRDFLQMLNSRFPARIRWEDDGTYDRVLVLKAKNYVLDAGSKRTIKGSALKATLKEPALREFIHEVIDALIYRQNSKIPAIYNKYASEIMGITDISRWSSKKTITESVLRPERTNEQKVLDALDGSEYAQGDKVYVYFRTDQTLALSTNWFYDHCVDTLLEKLYKTLLIFKPVYDITQCPNYALKRNKTRLADLTNVSQTAYN
jgi:DNA polymerase I